MKTGGITIVMATMLAACGLTMQSDDRIRVNTAGVLGLSPDELGVPPVCNKKGEPAQSTNPSMR